MNRPVSARREGWFAKSGLVGAKDLWLPIAALRRLRLVDVLLRQPSGS
jgi:hypothetical protein